MNLDLFGLVYIDIVLALQLLQAIIGLLSFFQPLGRGRAASGGPRTTRSEAFAELMASYAEGFRAPEVLAAGVDQPCPVARWTTSWSEGSGMVWGCGGEKA